MIKLTEHVLEWSNALRSGEYLQAEGALELEGAYCCLGVACVLTKDPLYGSVLDGIVHEKTRGYFGLETDGFFSTHEEVRGLAAWQLNDGVELSFEEIAYLIDEEYAKQQGIYDVEEAN